MGDMGDLLITNKTQTKYIKFESNKLPLLIP